MCACVVCESSRARPGTWVAIFTLLPFIPLPARLLPSPNMTPMPCSLLLQGAGSLGPTPVLQAAATRLCASNLRPTICRPSPPTTSLLGVPVKLHTHPTHIAFPPQSVEPGEERTCSSSWTLLDGLQALIRWGSRLSRAAPAQEEYMQFDERPRGDIRC